MELKPTVVYIARDVTDQIELFNGVILLSCPRINDCKIFDGKGSVNRVFCDGQQFDCATPFAYASLLRPRPASKRAKAQRASP